MGVERNMNRHSIDLDWESMEIGLLAIVSTFASIYCMIPPSAAKPLQPSRLMSAPDIRAEYSYDTLGAKQNTLYGERILDCEFVFESSCGHDRFEYPVADHH